jgi:GH25 family lysozyme M1 (1,4-beta-N-acetylmuramidase)
MSITAPFLSSRRALLGAAIALLAAFASITPVGAWSSASPHAAIDGPQRAAPRAAPAAGISGIPASAAGSPVGSRKEALAAGGRKAPGGKAWTVVRYGIDVSHWQGRIDWKRVARSGRVQFVIAKATEGTWRVDPMYARNKKLAQQQGLYFTAYHFANPSPERGDARREADWFLRHADLRGPNLLPALDLEDHGGLSAVQLERWVFQWMRRVEQKLGVKPMLYTSPGFWSGYVADSRAVARAGFDTLWLSHWGVRKPWIPANRWAGEGWSFWQWTETGSVAGIGGAVDRNVYSGAKLQKLTIRALRRDGSPSESRDDRPPRPKPRSGVR